MGAPVGAAVAAGVQVAVVSAKGSPGVTTLCWAAGLLWPGPIVVGELDPAGGDLAARLPLDRGGGLAALATTAGHTVVWGQLAGQLQPATETCAALLAPADAVACRQAVTVLAGGLPAAARSAGVSGLWDLGRLDATSPAWAAAEACDVVAVLVGARAGEVAHAVVLVDQLLRRGCPTAVAVAEPSRRRGGYRGEVVIDEIVGRVSGPLVSLGTVIADPAGVAMAERVMSRWGRRCALGGSVRRVIAGVGMMVPAPAGPVETDRGAPGGATEDRAAAVRAAGMGGGGGRVENGARR